MDRRAGSIVLVLSCSLSYAPAYADPTIFFQPCQSATLVNSGVTSDTIRSNGYLFTYTRDKLFTGGTGQPIGRPVRVAWPTGVEAQAVTTPPPGVTDYTARITLERADGHVFDLTAFTAKLLANTAGAGAAIEIMPLVNGEDAFPDPLYFDATGYYGQTFSYDTSPNSWGSTALLVGFDTYKIGLYVDFAFVALTLDATAAGEQSCCLAGSSCADLAAAACVVQGGTPQGGGTSCSCNPCAPPPGPAPAPDGRNGTTPLRASRLTVAGDVVQVDWDATSCPAPDYNLIYGSLSGLPSYGLSGALCSIGTTGSFLWAGAPAGAIYFLVVGADQAGAESSWGLDGAGHERNGASSSDTCGVAVKNVSSNCP